MSQIRAYNRRAVRTVLLDQNDIKPCIYYKEIDKRFESFSKSSMFDNKTRNLNIYPSKFARAAWHLPYFIWSLKLAQDSATLFYISVCKSWCNLGSKSLQRELFKDVLRNNFQSLPKLHSDAVASLWIFWLLLLQYT